MIPRRSVLGGLAAASLLGLSGCNAVLGRSRTLKMQLTLQVSTPSGPKAGGGVVEVYKSMGSPVAGSIFPGKSRIYGQSPILDLGVHGAVFALLYDVFHRAQISDIPYQAMAGQGVDQRTIAPYARDDWREAYPRLVEHQVTGSVTDEFMPLLVWMSNPGNPRSARVLNRYEFGRIGEGFRFQELAFAFVDDDTPVDLDLPERYPAIMAQVSFYEPRNDVAPADRPPHETLRRDMFFSPWN